MNYYKASQREETGKWDFTCTNDGRTWPVGYCAGWREGTEEDFKRLPGLREEQERLREHKDKYHTHGHDTAEEAEACYQEYLLDNRLRFSTMSDQQRKCQVPDCGVWTQGIAYLGKSRMYVLCDEHKNRETVAKLDKPASQIWSS